MNELPFTIEQFLELFEVYNRSKWLAQFIAYVLGGSALFLVIRKKAVSDTFINLILGTFWIWMGAVYHIFFFTGINRQHIFSVSCLYPETQKSGLRFFKEEIQLHGVKCSRST